MSLTLKIGVMDSIPKKICRELVQITSRENNARITIFEESLASLTRKLSAHEIDLIIANDTPPADDQKSNDARLVGELQVIFVAHPDRFDLKRNIPRY